MDDLRSRFEKLLSEGVSLLQLPTAMLHRECVDTHSPSACFDECSDVCSAAEFSASLSIASHENFTPPFGLPKLLRPPCDGRRGSGSDTLNCEPYRTRKARLSAKVKVVVSGNPARLDCDCRNGHLARRWQLPVSKLAELARPETMLQEQRSGICGHCLRLPADLRLRVWGRS